MNYKIVFALVFIHAQFNTLFGQQIESFAKAKPISFSGNFGVTGVFYHAVGIPNRYLPSSYVVAGTPTLAIYGFKIPFSFAIGTQQSNFTQPFNEFGMSPTYKWITVHAGYRNVVFSPYTLAGHTFLGGGIELTPGKWRIGVIYGRFNKATALDTAQRLYFSNFTYKRTGLSVKLGYGTDNTYFDLIALKAKDHLNSLTVSKGLADSSGITPAENLVAGYSTRISLFNNHLVLESNGALSLYTSDVYAPPLHDSVSDKNIQSLNSLSRIRISSEAYSALDASIKYKAKFYAVKLQYRRVDPGFQSMGAYFLNNDLENYTIAPSFIAWKRRIRFNGSLGIQHDDLTKNKRSKANKTIAAASLSADFSEQLSVDASYSNYAINQTVKTIRFADSLKVVQSSSQLLFTPRYVIRTASLSHSISFSAILGTAKELNPVRKDTVNGNINTCNYLLNYELSFTRWLAAASVSLNHTTIESPSLTDQNNGLTLGLSKTAFKNKLTVAVSGGYLLNKRNNEKGSILTASWQSRLVIYPRHQLKLTGYYTSSRPENPSPFYPLYSETRLEVGYGFSL